MSEQRDTTCLIMATSNFSYVDVDITFTLIPDQVKVKSLCLTKHHAMKA